MEYASLPTTLSTWITNRSSLTAIGIKPALVVWGIWATMSVANILYVWRFGPNVPYYDDWPMIEMLGDDRGPDLQWLWQPRNDHRVPFPKAILLSLYELSGWNLKAGMYFNALLLSLSSFVLLRSAKISRGRQEYSDAFLPLILLNWGQYENLLWSWQITQVTPVVIVLFLLATMVRFDPPERAWLIPFGLAVLALAFCGIPGLVYVPTLALWLMFLAWRRSSAGRLARLEAAAACGLAVLALLAVPLYFAGLQTSVKGLPDPLRILTTMVAFISYGLGAVAPAFAPLSYVGAGAIMSTGVGGFLLAFRNTADEARWRRWGLLAFLGGCAALALSVGVARPGTTFAARYILQAAPIWCWLYLSVDQIVGERTARAARTVLALIALFGTGLNYQVGLDYGRMRHRAVQAFEADVRRGMPPSQLLARHQRALLPFPESGGLYGHDWLTRWTAALRNHCIGVFREMSADQPFVDALAIGSILVNGGGARSEGTGGQWTSPRPIFVHGIRVERPRPLDPGAQLAVAMTVSWKRGGDDPFTAEQSFAHWFGPEPSTTFWVYDQIKEIKVEVHDSDATFVVPALTLLAPAPTNRAAPAPRVQPQPAARCGPARP